MIAAASGMRRFLEKPRLFNGYADDMLASLRAQRDVTKPGGFIVCIVGNSLFGAGRRRLVVATDLLVETAARAAGLEVVGLWVARHLRRRVSDSRYLRESLVVMRRRRHG